MVDSKVLNPEFTHEPSQSTLDTPEENLGQPPQGEASITQTEPGNILSDEQSADEAAISQEPNTNSINMGEKLREIHSKVITSAGADDSIAKLMTYALESGDVSQMEIALEVYDREHMQFRRAIEHGWLFEPDPDGQVAVLKLLGFEDWHDECLGEVHVEFRRCTVTYNLEDGNPDIQIVIAQGTSQEVALRILQEATKRVQDDWDYMLRGPYTSDVH